MAIENTDTITLAAVPDAIVTRVASLPEVLENSSRLGRYIQAKPGSLLLRVPGVGAYLVRDGKTIELATEVDADPGAVDLFLHGAARAALLHQRGELPLHASALVAPNGTKAIALCGFSGAGKSTLSVEMHRRGWAVLADDTTRVNLVDGKPQAWPSDRGIKLWKDACDVFDLQTDSLEQVRSEMQKFYYRVTVGDSPVLLAAVVELHTFKTDFTILERIPERMNLLTRHTFRQRQVLPLGMMPHHLKMVSSIAPQLLCVRLGGARRLPVAELAERLEQIAQWIQP